ncbi:hypothetical protein [Bradyrhizobium sp. USDA 4452]
MTHAANYAVPEPGKFRRALAAAWAFLQAMESISFDYTLDRVERVEREVARLKEELRQSRNPEAEWQRSHVRIVSGAPRRFFYAHRCPAMVPADLPVSGRPASPQ